MLRDVLMDMNIGGNAMGIVEMMEIGGNMLGDLLGHEYSNAYLG